MNLPDKPVYNILSLGAGVQSTALALMSARGEHGIPLFDAAIFADTGAEPRAIYEHLNKLIIEIDSSFPVIICQHKEGLTRMLEKAVKGERFAGVPFYTEPKKPGGKEGMLRRQCTKEYKIEPITKAVRELLGVKYRQRFPKNKHVNSYQGLSHDELERQRDSEHKWQSHIYPLIDMKWRRNDCTDYLESIGWKSVAKSACVYCPYHSAKEWLGLSPEDFQEAIRIDELCRDGVRGTTRKLYLHRSCRPLKEIDFKAEAEKEMNNPAIKGIAEECEGICGL